MEPWLREVEWVLEAPTLQEAKTRFQERLKITDEPAKLRTHLWPILFGNEGEVQRRLLFGEPPSGKT